MSTTTRANKHSSTRSNKRVQNAHTHTHTLPCHSSSGIIQLRVLLLCALHWHTTTEFRLRSAQTEEQCFVRPKQGIRSEVFQHPLGNPTRFFLPVSQIALYLSLNVIGRTQKWPCACVSAGILRWMRNKSHWALSQSFCFLEEVRLSHSCKF